MKLAHKQTDVVDGVAILTALDHRLSQLDARRREIVEEIIRLEKSGGQHDGDCIVSKAEELLDGGQFVPPSERPLSALARLHSEKATIDRALKIGNGRRERLLIQRAADIYARHFSEIAQVEKRRVLLALALQGANRERERLRETLRKDGGGGIPLPTDGVELLDVGDRDDEVRWAVHRVVADGILSRGEAQQVISRGQPSAMEREAQ